jgi:hypothetical protein
MELYQYSGNISRRQLKRLGFPETRIEELASAELSVGRFREMLELAANDPWATPSILTEFACWRANTPVVFVNDQRLVDMVFGAIHSVRLNELRPPWPAFMVCFGNGIRADGIPLKPCLFGRINVAEVIAQMGYVPEPSREIICTVQRHSFGHICSTLPPEKDVHEYLESYEPWPHTNLNSEEDAVLRAHTRTLIGLCVFLQAFPGSLREGFPDSTKERFRRQNKHVRPNWIRLPEVMRASPKAHWRSCHFRALRDERYARNPDGTVRIVFVRDAIVGRGDAKPHHVKHSESGE